MPKPTQISRSKQLLVEGRDAEAFFYPFLEAMDITDVEIQNYGGINDLSSFLKQFVLNSQYKRLPVTSIGIIRDAEQSAEGAFRSVCSALEGANHSKPTAPSSPSEGFPKACVYILPDENSQGMIETLLLRALVDDPVFECVDRYLECVIRTTDNEPKPIDKAKFLAFLASKPNIKPLTGYAARAGYLNFESPVYDSLREFVNSL